MTRTNLILAGVLVAQLGLFLAIYLGKSEATVAKLEPILELDASAVTKLEIFGKDAATKNDGAPSVIVDRSSGTWQLGSHFEYPAAGSKVDDLVTKLAGMKAREPIATKAATHRKFAVADDNYERRVIIHQKTGEPLELYIGSGAGQRQTAVRIKGQEKVYGASGITAFGVNAEVTGWLDPTYYKVAGGLSKMVITNAAGEFEFKRGPSPDPWKRFAGDAEVPLPEAKVLDAAKVNGLANAFASVSLAEPANPASAFGNPIATVRFTARTDETEHTLTIAELKEERYLIKIDAQAPVWVAKTAVTRFVDLTGEDLYKDPPKEGETPPTPAGPDMSQLPPDVLRQLQQQGLSPQ